MYTLDAVLQDAARKRGKYASKDESEFDYGEVWNAYTRYLMSCLEQRRGLHLASFCRIGWQGDKPKPGALAPPKCRPFFQVTDQFIRAYTPREARNAAQMPNDLCPFEDFNYSKAAIKFSQQLTKDQVFTGLRGIVQQIGEAFSEGREVDIEFGNVGRLSSLNREPRFSFSSEVYSMEGMEAPPAPADDTRVGGNQRASSFRKEAPPEAMGLGIRGQDATQPLSAMQLDESPPAMPSLRLDQPPPRQQSLAPVQEEEDFDDRSRAGSLRSSSSAPNLMDEQRKTPLLTSQQYKREVAYKEAMDRHISEMEARASEAVREKESWHSHVNDCLAQERDEINDKRSRYQQNQYFLRQQVQWAEKKKKDQRREDIVAASAHDFPKFTEPADAEMKNYIAGQQARMRQDLDEQVKTNNTLRNLHKQRERALEVDQLQANRAEMAMLREAERAKKAYDKEALATAWNSEIRMKNIWKAIDNHNKVGSTASSHPPQVLVTDGLPPPSRGSLGSSTVSAGRLMTGSQRKVPMGASQSLSTLESRLSTGRSRR